MHTGMTKLINQQIDARELDRLARNNTMAKEKQKAEMLNMIRDMGQFYSYVTEPKVILYTERLQEKGIGLHALKQAYGKILDEYDKFPQFRDFLAVCRMFKSGKKKETYNEKIFREEEEKLNRIEENWNKVMGADRLPKFVEWWVIKCMGWDKESIESMGCDVMLWKKCALFDWCDSGYAKDINKIIDLSQKKIKLLKKEA